VHLAKLVLLLLALLLQINHIAKRAFHVLERRRLLFIVFGVLLIVFVRKNDSFLAPQFWAEDSNIFFKDSLEHGLKSLAIPYSGYLHTIQRIVAYITLYMPLEWIPFLYNYFAVLVLIYSIYLIVTCCSDKISSYFFGFSIVLVPHSNEILANLTNLHWYTGIFLSFIMLKADTKKSASYIISLFIFICSISGPFCLILLPFYLFQRIIYKKVQKRFYEIAFTLGCTIQLITIYHNYEIVNLKSSLFLFQELCKTLVSRIFIFSGVDQYYLNEFYIVYLVVISILFLICAYLNKFNNENLSICLYLISISVISFIKVNSISETNNLYTYPSADRYFYSYNYSVIFMILSSVRNCQKKLLLATMLILATSIATNKFFTHEHYKFSDYKWKQQVECLKNNKVCTLEFYPKGWTVDINATKYFQAE